LYLYLVGLNMDVFSTKNSPPCLIGGPIFNKWVSLTWVEFFEMSMFTCVFGRHV
jgi:hypothetical protein